MVAVWDNGDRYLASTLSQDAIIRVAEPFYKLCFYRLSVIPLHYSTLRRGVYSYCWGVLRGSDGIVALTVHSM